jgi:hypothetical protein
MSPDDLAVLIALGFVGFCLYAGLKRVAEAIEAFARRKIDVTVGPLPTIHVQHEEV